MTKKSLFATYLLWFVGGFFGVHHLYLGRDYQALIWFLFCGGGLGIGWLRDLWRIPDYVRDVNDDEIYLQELSLKMRKHPKPPFSFVRFICQQIVSQSFGVLAFYAVPQEFSPPVYTFIIAFLVPFSIGLGTYLVGNIGREEGSFKSTILCAHIATPIYFLWKEPIYMTVCLSNFAFDARIKKWRRTPNPRRSLGKRLLSLGIVATLYFALWASYLHHNCMVMFNEEEGIKCSEAAGKVLSDPLLKEILLALKLIITDAKRIGWEAAWGNFANGAFRNANSLEAFEVLNLTTSATQQEITARYREYVRHYHPDKNHDPNKKQYYMEKFMAVQRAYEILSDVKLQRIDKNVKFPKYQNYTE